MGGSVLRSARLADLQMVEGHEMSLHDIEHREAVAAYTKDEVWAALRAAGWEESLLQTMDAIAGAESSWLPNVIQHGQPYSTTGWGTWQITPGDSVPAVGTDRALLDIATNARAALVKFQAQGLNAWTTWRHGTYKKYIR